MLQLLLYYLFKYILKYIPIEVFNQVIETYKEVHSLKQD